ncbi:MAG: hypothetical protein ABIS36_21235 [Chryseolinea sp.]
MRYDKDTRRIGGLLLDLLMLSVIIFFSITDLKITRGYDSITLTVEKSKDDHKLVSGFDSVFSSFQKQISKIHPEQNTLGAIFKFPHTEDVRITVSATPYLYNPIFTNTTINAP